MFSRLNRKTGLLFLTLTLSLGLAASPALAERRSGRRSRRGTETEQETAGAIGPVSSPMDTINAGLVPQAFSGGCGTTYEIFVGSFMDSDGDGTGDLGGVLEKLDYLCDGKDTAGDDLGCNGIWLMPVFPSPTYHKYDVTDYLSIDPAYGDLEDFRALLSACHARDMRLILDLPLNHTSTQHPWFAAAADYLAGLPGDEEPSAADCPYVEYYNFSREAGEGYAPLAGTGWYYEARFWEGMPDLNLDSAKVRTEIRGILSFWLGLGVDGFRLDAVTSFYTGDHAKNIAFLTWLTRAVRARRPDAFLVGEAWENQETYARYYESGIGSMFDFAFSGAEGVIASVVSGKKDAASFARAMEEEEALYASCDEDYVNAPFYTNHDMARSAGYYAYDDGSRTKLAGALNLLMGGNCFVYYGEELGMKGSGKDENKRAPMYWTDEEDAEEAGMCAGPPDMDEIKMKFGSLAVQREDPLSVYRYYRHAMHVRAAFPVIAEGRTRTVEELSGEQICVFYKEKEELSPVLVVISTAEEEQRVDLSGLEGSFAMGAVLTTGTESPALEDGTLTLPPFGIAVLTCEGGTAE